MLDKAQKSIVGEKVEFYDKTRNAHGVRGTQDVDAIDDSWITMQH